MNRSTTKVSDMWTVLQQANKLPSSELMSGAEVELQELMRQIDLMVKNRKLEWETEKQTFIARLDVREKENANQKSTLTQTHTEIGHLRAQLEDVGRSQKKVKLEYEHQLSNLRDEIATMKREFEKLHRRYIKKAKHAESAEEHSVQVKRLNTKLEEYKKKNKDWESKQHGYEEKIKNLLQNQTQNSSTQQQHSNLATSNLDEALISNNILSDDKHELQSSLTHAHDTIKQLEEQLEKMQFDHRNESKYGKHGHGGDINNFSEEFERNKKVEVHYKKQIDALSRQLEITQQENVLLGEQLENKTTELTELEHLKLKNYSTQLSHLEADQQTLKSAHQGELEGMKYQMAAVTTQLHDSTLAIATLTDKYNISEKQLHEYTDELDKKHAELQVVISQLEALRLENRHLHEATLAQDGTDVDISEAERHLKQLQNAYSTSIVSLEAQNQQLQSDVTLLKTRLEAVEDDNKDRLKHALVESNKTIQMVQTQESRKQQDIEEKSRRSVQEAKDNLNATVEQYESQIETLQLQMSTMQDDIQIQSQSMKRAGLEHDVMAKFVNGVDQILQPSLWDNGNLDNLSHHTANTSLDMDDELEDDYLTDTAEAATAKFIKDQEERTRQLEEQLDDHIDYLKSSTDQAIRRHVSASH